MPHFGEFKLQDIPFTHLMHFTLNPGVTDVLLILIKAGCLPLPYRIERLAMSCDPAPGGANVLSFKLFTDGDSMTVQCTAAETSNVNTTGFNVNPATQDLTLQYSQLAAGASAKATITICRRYL